MKARPECHGCLVRLIEQATTLATEDPRLRRNAYLAAREILDGAFSSQATPARIATRFHQTIKDVTGNPDPFLSMKLKEMALAREIAGEHEQDALTLRDAVRFALAGNALDFFRDHDTVRRELSKNIAAMSLAVDDTDRLEEVLRLRVNGPVLYLTDNAGEQYFDLPLLRVLRGMGLRVVYAVKGGPVQNDLALADIDPAILPGLGEMADTGCCAVGIDVAMSSPAFRDLLDASQLVIAKGMGHYETLDHLAGKEVFLMLKAKCRPVAESVGVPEGAFTARLSKI